MCIFFQVYSLTLFNFLTKEPYYLSNYALKRMDPSNPLDLDTLGRVVYAMYNGGLGEFRKFLKRKETNYFYISDQLFWERYTLAKEGQFDKISVCILGK